LISSVAVAIRRMSATESTETLTIYQMSVITLCTILLLLPFGFTLPAWPDALGLAAAGVGNGSRNSGGRAPCRWHRPRRSCR